MKFIEHSQFEHWYEINSNDLVSGVIRVGVFKMPNRDFSSNTTETLQTFVLIQSGICIYHTPFGN